MPAAARGPGCDRGSGTGRGGGCLEEEFDLFGAPFRDRGIRADDALRALRASLSVPVASYHGTHHDYDDMAIDPCAVQARVPLWIGGRTRRSLRRALELADEWMPFGLDTDRLRSLLEIDRPEGFEVVLSPARALDPATQPGPTADALAELVAIGATVLSARIVAHSCQQYLEQLEALAALARLSPSD